MKLLMSMIVLAFGAFTGFPAYSQQGWLEATRPALKQGSWEVGGTLSIGYSSLSGLLIQTTPRAQYFIVDRLSVGGIAEYYKADHFERAGAGPAATFYFLETDRFVAFLAQNMMFTQTNTDYDDLNLATIQGATALGLNYFISPGLAVGFSYNRIYPLNDGEILGHTSIFRTTFLVYL